MRCAIRSSCPLTYSSSKARLQIPSASHWPGLLSSASCPRRAQPSAAGQRTKPPGALKGLAGTLGRFLPPSSPPGGPRHTLPREREREKAVSPEQQGGGRGGKGGGTACASRQDAGRRGRLRTGFLWGKGALSPCVDSPEHRQAPRGQDVKGRPEQVPLRPPAPRPLGARGSPWERLPRLTAAAALGKEGGRRLRALKYRPAAPARPRGGVAVDWSSWRTWPREGGGGRAPLRGLRRPSRAPALPANR